MWFGEHPKAVWLFATRSHPQGLSKGGYSNLNVALHVGDEKSLVEGNRALVAKSIASPPASVVWPILEHTTKALEIVNANQKLMPADILYTTNTEVTLATMSADCVPVIAIAQSNQFVLTAHAGWKGAAADIAQRIKEILLAHTDGNVDIFLGPAICGNCYQVDEERIKKVTACLPESQQYETGLDVRRGLLRYFADFGFSVHTVGGCTFESENLFSYRRNHNTGRQAAVVRLR